MPAMISNSATEPPFLNNDDEIFPDGDLGRLMNTLIYQYKIKQEPRNGWVRKNACDPLQKYPCESVASHMWGVAYLVMVLSSHPEFPIENFQLDKALQMAIMHDLAEVTIGDITPVDGVSAEDKHKREFIAINDMLDKLPNAMRSRFMNIYQGYENRECDEAKFVKDCDRLDFLITGFLLERQGFSGYPEFYKNSMALPFFVPLCHELGQMICKARERLNYPVCQ